MPRYFFNFTDDTSRYPDHEGEVLRDEAAARRHAVEDARYLLQHSTTGMTAEGGWRVEVSDKSGRVLFVVPFADVARMNMPEIPVRSR